MNDTRDFKKEDQDRLANLFNKLDAEILTVPGGHVGFIVQAEDYMDQMEKFLKKKRDLTTRFAAAEHRER